MNRRVFLNSLGATSAGLFLEPPDGEWLEGLFYCPKGWESKLSWDAKRAVR